MTVDSSGAPPARGFQSHDLRAREQRRRPLVLTAFAVWVGCDIAGWLCRRPARSIVRALDREPLGFEVRIRRSDHPMLGDRRCEAAGEVAHGQMRRGGRRHIFETKSALLLLGRVLSQGGDLQASPEPVHPGLRTRRLFACWGRQGRCSAGVASTAHRGLAACANPDRRCSCRLMSCLRSPA